MTEVDADRLEQWESLINDSDPGTKRLVLFVLVAIKNDVWPTIEFNASTPSETDEQCRELFHRMARLIPEAERARCWAEVNEVFPVGHCVT